MQAITDPSILEAYLRDASNLPGHAERLFRPSTAEEVAEIVALCQQEGTPLTVTARRSSTTGASVPMGGVLLSTEKLNRILGIHEVEGGVLLGEYQSWTEEKGWMFPPDPTSRNECSIGGAIACNASGARTYRYGPSRAWVESIRFVTPTGELKEADRSTAIPWPTTNWAEPPIKTAAGYFPANNLLDLMIGQEGTLGVILSARLRLRPLPPGVLTIFAYFPTEATMMGCLDAIRALGGRYPDGGEPGPYAPRCIEYFDRRSLELIQARLPELPQAHAALLIEIEHDGEAPLEPWFDLLTTYEALLDHTIIAEDERGRAKLHAIRHALPAAVNEIISRNGVQKVGTDFAVPDAAFPEMLRAYDAVEMAAVCFGHLGNNHLHLNLLPKNLAELAEAKAIYMELAKKAVSLGGTVSAEHGIGKLKRTHLALMVPPLVREGWAVMRKAADPNGILGRGNLLDPS